MRKKEGVLLENIKEKHLVVKSNKLIEASYKLSLQEARIILLLTSMIQRDDEDFNLVRIRVKDFIEFIGVKDKDAYKRIQNITDSLGDKSLIIRGINDETKEQTRLKLQWLASAEYFKGSGYVELEFSQKLKPFLLQLKNRFTKYQLEHALKLKKSYSIRIYELLKQWEKIKTRSLEVDELRQILGIEKGKYKYYANLKERVLKPAQKEISKKTDISFEFTEIKKGRKVIVLRFEIKPKNINQPESPSPPRVEKIKNTNLYQRLIDYFCINAKDAIKVLNEHQESQILENLAYVEHQRKKGKIQNLGAYTLIAIKNNYKFQMGMFDKEEEESRKKKQQKDEERQKQNNLKRLYVEYRRNKINEFKESISPGDLKKLQTQCKETTIKKRGKNQIGFAGFVRYEMENCIAERTNILKFDEWAAEYKN